MAARLEDALDAARARRFVGRLSEIELLRSALAAPELPFCVLYLYGPGGVGKTTLIRAFAALGRERSLSVTWLDARGVEPNPDAFLAALRAALELAPDADPVAALHDRPAPALLLIDTFEVLQELDGWFRDVFLPALPPGLLTVLSGRVPPDAAWRADPGWQTFVRALPLRNLSPDESRDLLAHRDVPVDAFDAILAFTHGHPLALSLVAELFAQHSPPRFAPESAPDVIQPLLARFLENVPDIIHRNALEACALAYQTTEPLLDALLDADEAQARAAFRWLRGLSFIEAGRAGLHPHDIVRETLLADLRWRDPDGYTRLHRRARDYYTARLRETQGQEQQRLLYDFIFLHRDNPIVRSSFLWQDNTLAYTDAARPNDLPLLVAMTEKHEGAESAALARRWFARPNQRTLVFRNGGPASEPLGFLTLVYLHLVTPKDRAADPAIEAACRHLERNAPLRRGEVGVYFRFWMARDTYQDLSPLISQMVVTVVRHDLTTPGLAYTLFPCANPDFWALAFEYAEKRRVPDADFEAGGIRYGVFAHDWRALPATAWLSCLADKEMGGEGLLDPPCSSPTLIVLSRPEFDAAVKRALSSFADEQALRENPLLRSRVVAERVSQEASPSERVTALCRLLHEAAESLRAAPKTARGYRTLLHTYLEPVGTQEAAAARLDLPFSTYRRHLGEGLAHVTAWLWAREVEG